MKNGSKNKDDVREEYDFSGGVRGKYAAEYRAGANIVIIAPDLARVFPDSESVNEALRTLIRISEKRARKPRGPAKKTRR